MAKNQDMVSDIIIIGGGMIGLTLACGLAGQEGLEITVVDALSPDAATDSGFDGRSSAIAYASYRMLDAIGVWQYMADEAEPIREIRVSDGDSKLFLHFDHAAVGDEPLGFMVENRHIRKGLFRRLEECGTVKLIAPDRLESMDRTPYAATAKLASGLSLRAPLLIGADGRGSFVRRLAGIRTSQWRYDQTGIVATVSHTLPHHDIAHERFLPPGPFAILPLSENRSSLVWTADADLAPHIMALSDRAFLGEVQRRMGNFLGDVALAGPRFSHPLGLHFAEHYVGQRLALIGDAAHGIHPIAGQGLNMGFRDCAALIEILADAARLGLDIGDKTCLERYEKWRRTDNLLLAAVTDGLNRLFSNDLTPVRVARDIGLAAVHRLPPLKKFFIQHARGTVGRLPKLLTGRPV